MEEIIKSTIGIIPSLFATAATVILPLILLKQKQQEKKIDSVHILVNSNMGLQLKMTWAALQRLAMVTKKTSDRAAAKEAEDLYNDHQVRQKNLDVTTNERTII